MDKQYVNLFKELAKAAETSAEQVMEYDKTKKDDKGYAAAETMRNDFAALADKIDQETFNGELTRNEYIQLLAGTLIVIQQLKDRLKNLQKAIDGYDNTLIPKLTKIIDNSKTDEEAIKIAAEEFKVEVKD